MSEIITAIKMITLSSGPNGTLLPGQIYLVPGEVSERQARDLVAGRYAEVANPVGILSEAPAEKEPEIETADVPVESIETAVPAAPVPGGRGFQRPIGKKATK